MTVVMAVSKDDRAGLCGHEIPYAQRCIAEGEREQVKLLLSLISQCLLLLFLSFSPCPVVLNNSPELISE